MRRTCRTVMLLGIAAAMLASRPAQGQIWGPPRVAVRVANRSDSTLELFVNGYFCGPVPAGWHQDVYVVQGNNDFLARFGDGLQVSQNLQTYGPRTWEVGPMHPQPPLGPREPKDGPPLYPPKQPLLGFNSSEVAGVGIQVNWTEEGSVAKWMGLRRGDLIVTVNGQAIGSRADYDAALLAARDEVKLEVLRDRERIRLEAVFGGGKASADPGPSQRQAGEKPADRPTTAPPDSSRPSTSSQLSTPTELSPSSTSSVSTLPIQPRRSRSLASYHFAYMWLPKLAFDEPQTLIEALAAETAPEFLRDQWERARRHVPQLGEDMDESALAPGLRVETASADGLVCYVIVMPEPKSPPEAHFAAVLVHKPPTPQAASPVRYFTLELGQSGDGKPMTFFCEWSREGTHVNYGPGPVAEVPTFAAAVFERVLQEAGEPARNRRNLAHGVDGPGETTPIEPAGPIENPSKDIPAEAGIQVPCPITSAIRAGRKTPMWEAL